MLTSVLLHFPALMIREREGPSTVPYGVCFVKVVLKNSFVEILLSASNIEYYQSDLKWPNMVCMCRQTAF